jgi:hypothetical protein
LSPREAAANRTLEIFLEPMLHARDGLFDRDDPRVDRGLEIAYESRLDPPEPHLERSQVIVEGCRRMLEERPER